MELLHDKFCGTCINCKVFSDNKKCFCLIKMEYVADDDWCKYYD